MSMVEPTQRRQLIIERKPGARLPYGFPEEILPCILHESDACSVQPAKQPANTVLGTNATAYVRKFKVEDTSMILRAEVENFEVVIKFSYQKPRRIANEAMIYQEHLFDLQGKVVPRFYGLYQANVQGRDISAMVLEDCGEVIVPEISNLTKEEK